MAELSLSQLIQESLSNDYISEGENKKDKSFWQKTKDTASSAWNSTKEAPGKVHGKVGNLGTWISQKLGGNATSDSLRGKIAAHIGRNPHAYGYGAGALGTAAAGGLTYGAVKGAKALFGKKSALDRAKGFVKKHPYGTAGASLAALGAGVGTAALLRYLRKKKKQG